MIKLTINGQEIAAKEGTTVMEVALANGIDIPHLCYHHDLPVSGNCRMCLVEVAQRPLPTPACHLTCEDGLVVQTESEQLADLRRDLLDLYLADHPLNCLTCDKAGACDLQKYAYRYGVRETSYHFTPNRTLYQEDNPFFIRDHQYCILCSKCVRVCNDVVGAQAITLSGRGTGMQVSTPFDGPMINSDCVFCGSCVQVCPTAALISVGRKGQGREWEMERIHTICGYCGVGCNIEVAMKEGAIVTVNGTGDNSVNDELLCTKGRYGWDFVTSTDRLTTPMLRRDLAYALGLSDEAWQLPERSVMEGRRPQLDDTHIPIDWETALDLAATKLADTVQKHGSDAVMGLCSARCTNEDNYLFQKFFRASIKTNNLDHCARL